VALCVHVSAIRASARGTHERANAGYGVDTNLRTSITALGLSYVAGIQSHTTVWAPGTGPRPAKKWSGHGRPPKLLRRDNKHNRPRSRSLRWPCQSMPGVRSRGGKPRGEVVLAICPYAFVSRIGILPPSFGTKLFIGPSQSATGRGCDRPIGRIPQLRHHSRCGVFQTRPPRDHQPSSQ
jgi:hypothetical protein